MARAEPAHLKAFTPQHAFGPCIQARASIIPTGPDCLHEIKDHGYRLMVQREDDRVPLFTRGGFHGTDHFPLIVEAARRVQTTSLVSTAQRCDLRARAMVDR